MYLIRRTIGAILTDRSSALAPADDTLKSERFHQSIDDQVSDSELLAAESPGRPWACCRPGRHPYRCGESRARVRPRGIQDSESPEIPVRFIAVYANAQYSHEHIWTIWALADLRH